MDKNLDNNKENKSSESENLEEAHGNSQSSFTNDRHYRVEPPTQNSDFEDENDESLEEEDSFADENGASSYREPPRNLRSSKDDSLFNKSSRKHGVNNKQNLNKTTGEKAKAGQNVPGFDKLKKNISQKATPNVSQVSKMGADASKAGLSKAGSSAAASVTKAGATKAATAGAAKATAAGGAAAVKTGGAVAGAKVGAVGGVAGAKGIVIAVVAVVVLLILSIIVTISLNTFNQVTKNLEKHELCSVSELSFQGIVEALSGVELPFNLNDFFDDKCRKSGEGYTGEVFWPASGPITSPYDPNRECIAGQCYPHEALDLDGGGCGAPIYAYAGGEVTLVVEGAAGFGEFPAGMVIVKHDDSFSTMYLHMFKGGIDVKVGDIVDSGQKIAEVGSTGHSTGCHLHWEYIVDGKKLDPQVEAEKCEITWPKTVTEADEPIMCGSPTGTAATNTEAKKFAKQHIGEVWDLSGAELETQWRCYDFIIFKESSWNHTALNPAFSPSNPATPEYQAYGLPQSGPGSKMASAGSDWKTNPKTQLKWGLQYVKDRYGKPCDAKKFWDANNWY